MSVVTSMSTSPNHRQSEIRSKVTFAQLVLRAMRRWQRKRAFNALSQLSDRQLDDIGFSRNDIPKLVEAMFTSTSGPTKTE